MENPETSTEGAPRKFRRWPGLGPHRRREAGAQTVCHEQWACAWDQNQTVGTLGTSDLTFPSLDSPIHATRSKAVTL